MKYCKEFVVSSHMIDYNNHLNNVIYLQWMEQLAVEHTKKYGGFDILSELGTTWFAKTQHIDYFAQAFNNYEIVAETFIESYSKVTARRKYLFSDKKSGKKLVESYTDWVYISITTSKPKKMCDRVVSYLELCRNDEEGSSI